MAMAANDENLLKSLETPTHDRIEETSYSTLLDMTIRQSPMTGAAVLDNDRPAHPEDHEMTKDISNSNLNQDNEPLSQLRTLEGPIMTPSTIRTKISEPGSTKTTGLQNQKLLEPSSKTTTSPIGRHEIRSSYAGALLNQQEIDHIPSCKCDHTNPIKAITIPISIANTYHQAAKTLLPHGQVEAISLDPISQLHTAIFNCGCQATKAKTTLKLVTEPFIPPADFESEYNPRDFFENYYKQNHLTRQTSPTPPASEFPRFFCIIPKDKPSTIDILAFLSREIGHLQPNSITRVKNYFTLRVEKDSQSLMIAKIDLSNSKTIKQIYPHLELNTSKAVCYNRELYNTTEETIKSYTSPKVLEVHQIKSTNNITIITFPTSQPPKKIEILGLTLNLEPYREKPKQCKKCFSYMHKYTDCRKEPRCSKCSLPSSTHTNEACNRDSFCYLCRGNHPPTSRTCPIYISEEDLLNEALKRGCGRGHIRAEKRRAANLKETREKEPRPTQPPNQASMEEKSDVTPTQSENWTEKQSRRKRRRQSNNQPMTLTPDLPTFELPPIYRNEQSKETFNVSPNAEDGLKPPTQQKTIPQSTTPTNLQEYPCKPSITDEETMEVNLDENPTRISAGEDESLPATFTSPLQTKTPITTNQQAPIQTTSDDLSSKTGVLKRHNSGENEYEHAKSNADSSPSVSSREPPKKRGKQSSPNSQNTTCLEKTPTPPTRSGSKKSKRCNICKTNYKTIACYKEHLAYFHPYPNSKPNVEKIPNYDATKVPKDHKCSEVPHERCLTLYKIDRGSLSEEKSHLVDNRESIYESISHFRRGIKRPSSALKQSNKEKIYGPQTTDNNLKHEKTETNRKEKQNITSKHKGLSPDHLGTGTTNSDQSQSPEAQKPPPDTSQVAETQRLEKPLYSGNIVKNVVAQLEVARKTYPQHNPLQLTWPNQMGHLKNKIQYSPSTRDPRLRSYSDLYKPESGNTQSQGPNTKSTELSANQQPKVKQDSPQLHRTSSLNSLHDSKVHQIQTLISSRNIKAESHTVHHNLK